jgi:hypothetical protein
MRLFSRRENRDSYPVVTLFFNDERNEAWEGKDGAQSSLGRREKKWRLADNKFKMAQFLPPNLAH